MKLFVVRPTGDLPIILEVDRDKKKTLAELGVRDLTDVVVFDIDSDIPSETPQNTTMLYHNVAQKFDIQRHEYNNLLPKSDSGTFSGAAGFGEHDMHNVMNLANERNQKASEDRQAPNVPRLDFGSGGVGGHHN